MPRKKQIPQYGQFTINGQTYYRTRIKDSDGARVSIYGKTCEEVYEKVQEAKALIKEAKWYKEYPTLEQYARQWLLQQSAHLRNTTLTNYTYNVEKYIIQPLGHKYMVDITADDIKLAMIEPSKKSHSIYSLVHMLYKNIFNAAVDGKIIESSPCERLSAKGGKPSKEVSPLTDEQVEKLIAAIKGLKPYVFVMIGLYAGLRREEILGLQWDCVHLDCDAPYIAVKRAWHIEHNRPVILDELKTNAARRDIPIPNSLIACLNEAKAQSSSQHVIANSEGEPLSYTQFKRLWAYITTRTTKERTYYRYINGHRIKRTVRPVLGEKAAHNSNVVYSLDFNVTPHQLRHTYITNLIYAGVDPKTVQYLAGHEKSEITMDIYAKAKYNKPNQLANTIHSVFN